MEPEILQEFIKHAESYLPTIRGGILVCSQEGNAYGELHTSLRQVQIIKDSASVFELDDIKNAAEELESEIAPLAAGKKISFPMSNRANFWTSSPVLEANLTKLSFTADFFPDDVTDFIEESFENLQINTASKRSQLSMRVNGKKNLRLTRKCSRFSRSKPKTFCRISTRIWRISRNNPNNRESLLEVRRSAHTLKGSAGIVGLKQLSDLAHRVEDLLDFMAENEIESNEKIFELLLTSTDCLNRWSAATRISWRKRRKNFEILKN